MKAAFLSSFLLAALCASIAARSSDDGGPTQVICGSSLASLSTLPIGHTTVLGSYETQQEAFDALESEEGITTIGGQLAAEALAGFYCSECVFSPDGACPSEVLCDGWEDGDVQGRVRFDAVTGLWIASAELVAPISFGLTCNECVQVVGVDN